MPVYFHRFQPGGYLTQLLLPCCENLIVVGDSLVPHALIMLFLFDSKPVGSLIFFALWHVHQDWIVMVGPQVLGFLLLLIVVVV